MITQNMVNTKCTGIYNEVKIAALKLQKKLLRLWSGNEIKDVESML